MLKMKKEKKSLTELNQTRAKAERYKRAKKTRMKMTLQKSTFQLR